MNFCGQCGTKLDNGTNYCLNCGKQLRNINQVQQEQTNYNFEEEMHYFKKIENNMKDAKISFILAIIPFVLFFYCAFMSFLGNVTNGEHGSVYSWFLIGIYCAFLGIPIMIISIILAFNSYRVCKSKLALCSLIINSISVLFYVALLL